MTKKDVRHSLYIFSYAVVHVDHLESLSLQYSIHGPHATYTIPQTQSLFNVYNLFHK